MDKKLIIFILLIYYNNSYCQFYNTDSESICLKLLYTRIDSFFKIQIGENVYRKSANSFKFIMVLKLDSTGIINKCNLFIKSNSEYNFINKLNSELIGLKYKCLFDLYYTDGIPINDFKIEIPFNPCYSNYLYPQ